jgi:tyrosine-protein kinase Etk/Wzc
MEIIHSRPVISKALDGLNFGVSYFLVGDLITSEMYRENIPFRVVHDTLSKKAYREEFNIQFEPSGKIKIGYSENIINAVYNETIKTPFGSFSLIPNTKFDQNIFLSSEYKDRNFIIVFNEKEKLIDEFYAALKVNTVNKMATVVELSIKTTVPEKGRDFLNEITNVYIQNGIEQKSEMAANTLEFIKERLKFVNSDLVGIETEVEQYKKSRGIADISEEAKYFLKGVQEYDYELSKINMELAYVDEIKAGLNDNKFKSPIFTSPVDRSIERLVGDLYNLEALKIKYENTIKEGNPLNVILKGQIQTAKQI